MTVDTPAPTARAARGSSDDAATAVRNATRRGLRLLARRARTRHELRERLAADHTPAAVEQALERLTELGYLDDTALAAAYLSTVRAGERSASMLRRELLRRGVAAGTTEAAVASHDDERASLAAAQRRLRALSQLDPERRMRRLRDHLLRRGFDSNTVRHTLAAALDGAPSR